MERFDRATPFFPVDFGSGDFLRGADRLGGSFGSRSSILVRSTAAGYEGETGWYADSFGGEELAGLDEGNPEGAEEGETGEYFGDEGASCALL